jgi:hypothetical protein
MKRISKLTVIALAAFLLLSSLPVMAKERPFALNGNGVATFITDGAGNPIAADTTTTATATHLGLCTIVARVNFTPDPNNPGRLLSSGSGTITAANGDTILVEFSGVLEPPEPGSTTAIDRPVFHFVGGTGRFAGVSGSANTVVVLNLLTGAFEATMVGNIDY